MRDYDKCVNCAWWNPDTESPYQSDSIKDACVICDTEQTMTEEDWRKFEATVE